MAWGKGIWTAIPRKRKRGQQCLFMDTWTCFFFSEVLWDPTWAGNAPADPKQSGDDRMVELATNELCLNSTRWALTETEINSTAKEGLVPRTRKVWLTLKEAEWSQSSKNGITIPTFEPAFIYNISFNAGKILWASVLVSQQKDRELEGFLKVSWQVSGTSGIKGRVSIPSQRFVCSIKC